MGSEGVQVLFGTFPVGNRDPFIAENSVNTAFSILEAHHVKHLDSAQAYGQAEQKLGELKAGNRFTIDTKWKGGLRGAGWSTRENIVNSAKESLQKLGVEQVGNVLSFPPSCFVPILILCSLFPGRCLLLARAGSWSRH